MSTLVRDINDSVDIAYKTKKNNINKIHQGYELIIQNPDKTTSSITTSILINSAGLYSSQISELLGIKDNDYKLSFWKGEYFWVSDIKKNYLKTLIYPIPDKNIEDLNSFHTDLNGRLKFGPNATYIRNPKNFDYSIDIKNKKKFYDAINRYLPSINITQLNPDFSGIRPKLQKPGSEFHDFVITNEKSRNFHNFINLIGIESPGLTASLAIGDYVTQIIDWGEY